MLAENVELALWLLLLVRLAFAAHGFIHIDRLGKERPQPDSPLAHRTVQEGCVRT